jgi:hypothetical protein
MLGYYVARDSGPKFLGDEPTTTVNGKIIKEA